MREGAEGRLIAEGGSGLAVGWKLARGGQCLLCSDFAGVLFFS